MVNGGRAASAARVQVGARAVGPGLPALVIAEVGVNHNGSLELARELIRAAARAGADAVKFQTFSADRLVTRAAPKAAYQQRAGAAGETQYEMLRRLELTADHHRQLVEWCEQEGILFLSTPHDDSAMDLLRELRVAAWKVGSGDLTNLPFLRALGAADVPVLLSTGMATLAEVERAVAAVREGGAAPLVLLHCVSSYPASPAAANLAAMETMRQAFGLPVGYSDHTLGDEVALAAVALGACVVEKHLTLDRGMPGPDHAASLEPAELTAFVTRLRHVEAALGDGIKRPMPEELDTRAVARKSLVAACDIAAGTCLVPDMVVIRRPGTGIPPGELGRVTGLTLRRPVTAGTVLDWSLFQ